MDVNNISSSCKNEQCSFSYARSLTPVLNSISPLEGFGGELCTRVYIMCSNCGEEEYGDIYFGDVKCEIVNEDANGIYCCPGTNRFLSVISFYNPEGILLFDRLENYII